MAETLSRKLIASKLIAGEMQSGKEIALRMDQALLQDVLGPLVILELEAMEIERAKTEPSVLYIDHSLVQQDHLSAETHLFLKSACDRLGIWYSGPGNGISHPTHMERFGVPGQSLIGCDSHTPAAGSLGMLAIGAGGVEVALAIAGQPLYLLMPEIWGIELHGRLPDWVSARDVILELLRRHGVAGAKNTIIEYYGPGLASLTAMDRHILAHMGAELGATTSVFPSDEKTRQFLCARGRETDWKPLSADSGCDYDRHERVNLSELEPLIARPHSPDNVVPVRDVIGEPVYQAYIGSSACPGYSEFATAARMVRGRTVVPTVSFDVNPSTRQVLQTLIAEGHLIDLIKAGARLHQAGCNGCIGMGQAPAQGRNSLRTVPRNFPGRSGTREDSVFLCSVETAAASALCGVITDPRDLGLSYERPPEPESMPTNEGMFIPPSAFDKLQRPSLLQTEDIPSLPELKSIPDALEVPILLKMMDSVSTDEIIPAGHVLPHWSNVFVTSKYAFESIDATYPSRAEAQREAGGHAVIAGQNYGQGSSRENAALVPAVLGLRIVIAQSFARIHWQNLISFGVLPLVFTDPADYQVLEQGQTLRIRDIREQLAAGRKFTAQVVESGRVLLLQHELSSRQREILGAGGVINWLRRRNT